MSPDDGASVEVGILGVVTAWVSYKVAIDEPKELKPAKASYSCIPMITDRFFLSFTPGFSLGFEPNTKNLPTVLRFISASRGSKVGLVNR
jgi:hypothetical protein